MDFSRLDPCSLKRYQRYYAEELDVSPGSSKGELVAAIGRHFMRQARASPWLNVKLSRPRASAPGLCQPMRSSYQLVPGTQVVDERAVIAGFFSAAHARAVARDARQATQLQSKPPYA